MTRKTAKSLRWVIYYPTGIVGGRFFTLENAVRWAVDFPDGSFIQDAQTKARYSRDGVRK